MGLSIWIAIGVLLVSVLVLLVLGVVAGDALRRADDEDWPL